MTRQRMPQSSETRFERLYARALRLYPEPFLARYAAPMRQTLRDALADGALPAPRLYRLVARDLVTSLAKEHWTVIREALFRPVLVFNALVLAAISTVLALALYSIPQQVLRQGANDPQIEMAGNLEAMLTRYGVNDGLLQGPLQGTLQSAGGAVDLARSLSPFLIVYDDRGQALGSTAQLDGQTPAPPRGVFDYVRQRGEERVTWQPRPGVRIAAVVRRVEGRQPGFVLAGRSLREVEAREIQVEQMAGLAWLAMLGLILMGSLAFAWVTRRTAAHTA